MKRKALIIGVNRYAQPGCDLRGCVPDALRYKALLIDRAGYAPEDVVVLLDADATTENIKLTAIEQTSQLDGDDSYHLINSSHGAQTVDGDARTDCLCPYDFDWSPDRLISADWMHWLVARIPQSCRVRVVIDSCHSGDTLRDGIPRPGQPAMGLERSMPGAPVFTRSHGRHKRFRDMVQVFPSAGFIAACRSSETAADARMVVDGKVIYQGALSWFLCRHLELEGGIHRSLRKVHKAAYDELRAAGYDQHPVLRGPWEEISKGFCGGTE